MTVATDYPRLQQFGSSANGSASPVVLIGPIQIPVLQQGFSQGNYPRVTQFGATVGSGGSSSYFQLQIANSSSGPWTEIDRIEIPNAGIAKIDYGAGVTICAPGQWFQVTATQGTASRMSASLFGKMSTSDLVNI